MTKYYTYIKIRSQALQILGGKCQECGRTDKLQLHHRYYAKDSIRPKVHRECGNRTIKRGKEAIAHPERFELLCLSCHNSKEPRKQKIVNVSLLFEKGKSEVKV